MHLMKNQKVIFISAAETSGDVFGAHIMRALKENASESLQFIGVGGPLMHAEGLETLFPMEDIVAFGIFAVIAKLRLILKRMKEVVHYITSHKLDAIITIDGPDFHFRVLKKIKALKGDSLSPRFHFVAPSVWAWRPGRAKKIADLMDVLFCLLPFEPKYFKPHGLKAIFIGHPLVDNVRYVKEEASNFRKTHKIADHEKAILLLPGSRKYEVKSLLPLMIEAAQKFSTERDDLKWIFPIAPHMRPIADEYLGSFKDKIIFVEGDEDAKYQAFSAADFAIAASGTVSLELALTKTPHIICYKMAKITAMIAKRLIKTPFANLVNILLKREAVPELLQENCTADKIFVKMHEMIDDPKALSQQQKAFDVAMSQLKPTGQNPANLAATEILTHFSAKNKKRSA